MHRSGQQKAGARGTYRRGPDDEREYRPGSVLHLGLARESGATEEELIEAITHLAFYAGWPSGMAALTQLKTITADTGSGASG